MVKVELLEDVEGLGEKGDRISLSVSDQAGLTRLDSLKAQGLVKEVA